MSHFRCLLFTLASLIVAAQAALAQPRFDFDTSPGHLPKTVVPERYALSLTLDPEATQFTGQALLSLRVRESVAAITLHASKLTARRAYLGRRLLAVTTDEINQTWTLTPTDGQPIAPGAHLLSLDYDGQVGSTGSGLFQAPYPLSGKTVRMLATQLEAIFARSVFPSFDEPAFRTVFELTVRAPIGYEVLSNMNLSSSVDDGPMRIHHFAPTPPMPAYLVAVAVGQFDALAAHAAGVPLRVLSAPGKRDQGAYALAALQQLLPYFNDYFGLPYALPKLDLLAVPSNRRGAMEDWGLISFAERALLVDPATSGTEKRRRVFDIVAHEVAHQWFGNLVTAASWQEIWLNEAFATWLASKASDHFNPEWQLPLRQRQDLEGALARDAGAATRAIRSGPVLEDRVFDVFDDITYAKGGAVLTMLERWIGPDNFRRGLAQYMQDRQFSNATAGDLWFHFGKASGHDVGSVAATWTDQPGFPLVEVSSRCEDGQTRVELGQRRFTTSGHAAPALWQIPIVLSHDGIVRTVLLDQATQTLLLPGCPAQPTLLNPAGDGFYRVAYAPAQKASLAAAYAKLPAAAQVTLLSDSFALAQAGSLPMSDYLDLLTALPKVQGPGRSALVTQAGTGLNFLALALAATPAQAPLLVAARALLAPELDAVGWLPHAGESSETESLRSALIVLLAKFDDPTTVAQALAHFDADEAGRQPLPAAIRSAVIEATGRHADAPRFEQLSARLLKAQGEQDLWLYARALSSNRDPALARRVLALSLRSELPNNVAPWLPGMVGEQPAHAAMAYSFVAEHWAELAEKAGDMFGSRAWLLPSASHSFNDLAAAQRLRADQQRLAGAPGAAPAARVTAQIELQSQVRERESERLIKALEATARLLRSRP